MKEIGWQEYSNRLFVVRFWQFW